MFPERRRALLNPLFLLMSLLLAGCPRPVVNFGVDGEAHSAAELLKRVELAESAVTSLKGEARLGVNSPQGKGSVTLFAAVAHPGLMHLEQLDFFGKPQGVLVSDGTRFGLYDAQANTYFTGPASPQNLGRFLPVVMPPAELVAVLLGRAPRLQAESPELGFDASKGVYTLTLAHGEAVQRLEVKPPEERVLKSTVVGLRAYDLLFSELEVRGALTFPRRVRLEAASAKTTVELTWKDVTLNEAPDPTMFELEAPEGVPVVELDAQGKPLGR